jgi:hypothetical protein
LNYKTVGRIFCSDKLSAQSLIEFSFLCFDAFFLFVGGWGLWKGFGVRAGSKVMRAGMYKHADEKREEMN